MEGVAFRFLVDICFACMFDVYEKVFQFYSWDVPRGFRPPTTELRSMGCVTRYIIRRLILLFASRASPVKSYGGCGMSGLGGLWGRYPCYS